MRIVVSDSSCLIDLRKATLLEAFLRLPYEIMIPNTLYEGELLKFTAHQKHALAMKVVDVPGPGVLRAQQVIRDRQKLTIHDGFAFALAESCRGCILATGDGDLRTLALQHGIEVHGVLWIVDQIHSRGLLNPTTLVEGLRSLEQDVTVRLPRRELLSTIRRLESHE